MNTSVPAESAETGRAAASGAAEHAPVEVEIRRSVRFGRLMIVGAGIGAIVAVMLSLSFPVIDAEQYTMSQIAGFMLLIGGVIGLTLGALLALLLNLAVRRKHGTGVAVQSDVR